MADESKNAEYWAERMRIMEKALLDKGYDYVQNLEHQFNLATQDIEKELARWYMRFADNNDITLAEAKQLLSTGELKEFRWTVQEYIEHGRENTIDGRWMKQLENASARVHITALDSMKLQLQQQAELLYANQLDELDKLVRMMYIESYYHTAFEIQQGYGVGYCFMSLNDKVIEKVLAKPWTADGRTFRDRCWVNKEALVNSVNTHITQMIIRGEAPDKAIAAIAKEFGVSKSKAGRLVMTESAAFASAGQKDCYKELGVEQYRVVETFDLLTCGTCKDLDGKVFNQSEFEVGLTAPPFHPRCRGTTCPHSGDNYGNRFARGLDGKGYNVPGDMTYDEWYNTLVEQHGEDVVRTAEKRIKSESADKKQYKKYKEVLGKDAPKTFDLFGDLKYNNSVGYDGLKLKYKDQKIRNTIKSDEQPKTIEIGKQGKHIKTHENYIKGRSYLTITPEQAQELVDRYAGTGKIERTAKGDWKNQEVISTNKIIGIDINNVTGEECKTTDFKIHYAKKGVHIVPKRRKDQ